MKNLTMHSLFVVAALAAAAVSASAQTYKADIPMAFKAAGKQLAPGTYDLRLAMNGGSQRVVTIENRAHGIVALLVPGAGSDVPRAWFKDRTPKITFECLGSACSLSGLWNGSDIQAYEFPVHKPSGAATERMAVVTLGLTKAD